MSLKSLRSRTGTALTLSAALIIVFAGSAQAATIQVNSSVDPTDGSNCTLRQAIANADANAQPNTSCAAGTGDDTITFDSSLLGDTITVSTPLLVSPTMTGTLAIQGPGAVFLEVSGGGSSRVFHIAFAAFATANAVTISGVTISNGVVNGNGGGILNEGSLHLDHDAVVDNTATASVTGGAVNQVTALGGGIESSGGLLGVTSSEIAGNQVSASAASGTTSNTATARGAGIHASGDVAGILTIAGSTIHDNTAGAITTGNVEQANAEGGGIWSSAGATTSIIESTIANNSLSASGTSSQETGGGVETAITIGFDGVLFDDTVTGNDAANTGANLADGAGTAGLQIRNTIVAGAIGSSNCSGVTSLGHNLAEDATCGSATGDIQNTPAQLKPLDLYGGPTETRPPDTGSPAIDKGIGGTGDFDQRGLNRTWQFDTPDGPSGDGTDIGAVEIQGPFVSATDPASPSTNRQPNVIGGAEDGSTIELHGTSDCSDSPLGTGTTGNFALPGIAPATALALGSTTTFRAQSLYGTARSACSPTSVAYTVPPGSAPTPAPIPSPPAQPHKKKCKKKAKGKKRAASAKKKKCKKGKKH
jgi:hypothetical protein